MSNLIQPQKNFDQLPTGVQDILRRWAFGPQRNGSDPVTGWIQERVVEVSLKAESWKTAAIWTVILRTDSGGSTQVDLHDDPPSLFSR